MQQLKQAVDNDLKIDYLVTGGCMMTELYPFLNSPGLRLFLTRVTESVS